MEKPSGKSTLGTSMAEDQDAQAEYQECWNFKDKETLRAPKVDRVSDELHNVKEPCHWIG